MIKQEITSADTSIKTVNFVYKHFNWKPQQLILDYGGGKYDCNVQYLKEKYDSTVLVYDPYNRSPEHNVHVLQQSYSSTPHYVVCSNVLNVCKEEDVLRDIYTNLRQFALCGSIILITIYEGDKSSIGCKTTKGWQRNETLNEYIPLLSNYFPFVKIENRIISCHI